MKKSLSLKLSSIFSAIVLVTCVILVSTCGVIFKLTESTIKDNSRLFKNIDEVPRQAFTMGLKNIMNAKKILILANGANKAKAVYGLVKGEVTENLPASVLQLHPDCTLVCDEAAAELL